MSWPKPPPCDILAAIEAYLAVAYGGAEPSPDVRARLEECRAAGDALLESGRVERGPGEAPKQYALRLGNRVYPHMKLVVEATPDGAGHLFRADTHDRHVRPAPTSPDYKPFCELMEKNQAIAEAVEASWDRLGLPTFKRYLRRDLERRAGQRHAAQKAP